MKTVLMRAARVFIGVPLLCPVSFAQTLAVRVINGSDGHPLRQQIVVVQFLDEQPIRASSPLQLKTDASGEAQFRIPDSQPKHLNIRLALTSEHWHCACWVMTDTENVVHNGIMQTAPANKAKVYTVPANAKPGQIVFVATPFTFFERLLYPLIKE